jgi:hypothetical protein
MSRGPKARNALQTKLDRLYPRQDARTQLALDYSSEEDGLTLALFPPLSSGDCEASSTRPRFLRGLLFALAAC